MQLKKTLNLILVLSLILTLESGAVVVQNKVDASFLNLESNYGQDLYDSIYEKVKNEGKEMAVSKTLAHRNLSQEELAIIIPGSNIGKLIGTGDPTRRLDAKAVGQKRAEIQDAYDEEKELADLEVGAKMEVEQTEIFANGDESDSGFDLLVDLDIIDAILFGNVETAFSGAAISGGAAGNEVNLFGPGAQGANGPAVGRGRAGAAQSEGNAAGGQAAGVQGNMMVGPGLQQAIPDAGVVACPLNKGFSSAVSSIRTKEAEQVAKIGNQAGGNAGLANGGNNQGNGDANAGGAGGNGSDDGSEEDAPIKPEPPADWKRPLPCTSVFCLKIEEVYKSESSYLPTDNCIACHFEKINDAFKKTLDHNLIPSKATGNLMEAPKCKSFMPILKQNFIVMTNPILTPPNDDLIVKGDFIKNIVQAFEKYYSNPGRCDNGAVGGACKEDPDDRAEAAARALNNATTDTSPNDIMIEIETIVAAKKDEAAKIMKEAKVFNDAQNQSTQYQPLLLEIDTMNAFFDGFLKVYSDLTLSSPESPDYPCNILLNKPACS